VSVLKQLVRDIGFRGIHQLPDYVGCILGSLCLISRFSSRGIDLKRRKAPSRKKKGSLSVIILTAPP
jgi:hypothetical protein